LRSSDEVGYKGVVQTHPRFYPERWSSFGSPPYAIDRTLVRSRFVGMGAKARETETERNPVV